MVQLERKGIYAVLIVFLLAIGIGHFPQKATLADFSPATQMRAALSGQGAPLYADVAAKLEGVYAAVVGTPANTPSTIVSFLIGFPSLLLAIIGVLAYFTLRALEFSTSFSAFSAVVFVLAASALSFMPGAYGSAQLSCLFFFAFLCLFAMHVREKKSEGKAGGNAWLLACAFFAMICAYLSAAFAIAGIFVAAAFCLSSWLKSKDNKEIIHSVGLAAVFAVFAILSPEKALSFDVAAIGGAFYSMPFMIAAACCAVVLFFFSHARIEYLALAIGAVALSSASPLAAASLLVLPVAEGMSKASGNIPKTAKLACAYFVVFFAVFGIASQSAGTLQVLVAAALIAVLSPLLMHFYDYNNKAFFALFAAVLAAASVFSVMIYQQGAHMQNQPAYIDNDLADALSFFSGTRIGQVSTLQNEDAVRFYLPSARIGPSGDLRAYLVSGKPLPASGSYLIISVLDIDNMSGEEGFVSYRYAGNFSGNSREYALFASPDGLLLSREITAAGTLALDDGARLDPYGRYYGSVPLPRMLLLSANRSYSDKDNRLMVLDEDTVPPHLITVYSGAAPEISGATLFGKVAAYKVG